MRTGRASWAPTPCTRSTPALAAQPLPSAPGPTARAPPARTRAGRSPQLEPGAPPASIELAASPSDIKRSAARRGPPRGICPAPAEERRLERALDPLLEGPHRPRHLKQGVGVRLRRIGSQPGLDRWRCPIYRRTTLTRRRLPRAAVRAKVRGASISACPAPPTPRGWRRRWRVRGAAKCDGDGCSALLRRHPPATARRRGGHGRRASWGEWWRGIAAAGRNCASGRGATQWVRRWSKARSRTERRVGQQPGTAPAARVAAGSARGWLGAAARLRPRLAPASPPPAPRPTLRSTARPPHTAPPHSSLPRAAPSPAPDSTAPPAPQPSPTPCSASGSPLLTCPAIAAAGYFRPAALPPPAASPPPPPRRAGCPRACCQAQRPPPPPASPPTPAPPPACPPAAAPPRGRPPALALPPLRPQPPGRSPAAPRPPRAVQTWPHAGRAVDPGSRNGH
eukprot:scaffold2718_cov103-Isochrysis_galbana.AAC.1